MSSILYLSPGDNQQTMINKINQNFSSVSGEGGGVRGPKGDQGPRGPVGPQGSKGDPGAEGQRGTRWFFQDIDPAIDPLIQVQIGDYWSDTNDDNLVYIYAESGWIATGNYLKSEDPFKTITGVSGPSTSFVKNAIVLSSSTPFNDTLVISDSNITAADANPNYSKVLISTSSSAGNPILEFSKSNLQDGTAIDANKHPRFSWRNPLTNDYSLQFSVPNDSLFLQSGGNISMTSSNGIIQASGNTISLFSTSSTTISSSGIINLRSGSSSNILASSGNFDLTSTLALFKIPLTVSPSSNSNALIINNTSGDGISVSYTGATPASATLVDLKSGSSTQMYVKGDGKLFTKRIASTYSVSTQTGSGGQSLFITVGPNAINYYSVGTNVFNTGNTIIVPFYSKIGSATDLGIYLPLGSALTGTFASYISVGESLEFDVLSPDNTTLITYFGASLNGSTIAAGTSFAGTTKIKVTLMRVSSGTTINDWRIYYSTPTSAGKL